MLIQGVQNIGGTLDGDRRGLDGDRRCLEMLIQGVQRIRETLDGDRRCLDGDKRCSEMLIQGVQKIGGTNAKICTNSQKCAKTAEDKPGRICNESGLGSGGAKRCSSRVCRKYEGPWMASGVAQLGRAHLRTRFGELDAGVVSAVVQIRGRNPVCDMPGTGS